MTKFVICSGDDDDDDDILLFFFVDAVPGPATVVAVAVEVAEVISLAFVGVVQNTTTTINTPTENRNLKGGNGSSLLIFHKSKYEL